MHNGPFGDRFVIASPEFRAEIEAAEAKAPPPAGGEETAIAPASVGAAAAGGIVPQQLSRVIAEKPNPFQKLWTAVRENVSLGNMSDAAKGMAGLLRESNATGALEGVRATRNMKESLLALDKLSQPEQLDFYDKMEAGQQQTTPELQKHADVIRAELDKGTEHLKAGGHLDDYIENYMPHQYENEPIGAPIFGRGKGGSPGFLKERTYPTRAEAINAGLTPKFLNPAESAMARLSDQSRYLKTADALQAAEKAGYVTRYDANTAPPGLSPEGEPIVRLDPKFNKMAGLESGEYLSAPRSVAKLLDVQTSKGLEGHPIYQAMRKVNNGINQIQLLSAFHASTSISNDFKSRLGLGIQETLQGVLNEAGAQGRLARTAQGLGHIATSPAAPLLDFISGKKMLRDAMSGTDIPADVKTALMGGHRFTLDREYATGATLAFQRALAQDKYGQAALRAVPALLDQAMKPIMEHLVPALKTGAYVEAAKSELARLGPNATDAAKRYALGRLNDSLDNRMGQLTYDNGFWNKTAKNVGQVLLRSLGWNIGDLREGLGAVKDVGTLGSRIKGGEQVDPVVTHRMSYVAAEVIGSALVGSLYSYIKGATSAQPLPEKQSYKDYAFPKTGGFNKDKSPERFVPAGYMKEAYGYGQQPAATIAGKVSPLISLSTQLAKGHDYFDKPFRNPQDPIWKEALDTIKFAGQQLTPLSTRQGADNPRSKIGPFERQLGAPAPKYIYNPEAGAARDAAQYKRMNPKYLGGH